MKTHTYKKIELVGTSKKSVEDAIRSATRKANSSVRNLRWFEVQEIRGQIADGEVNEWQVGLKLAFTLEGGEQSESDSEERERKPLENVPSKMEPQDEPLK